MRPILTENINDMRFGMLTFSNLSRDEVLRRVVLHMNKIESSLLSVVTPNIFHLNLASQNPQMAATFNRADIRVPDGWPAALGLRIFRGYSHGRIAGSDLSLDILRLAARGSYTVALLGGSNRTLARAYENIALLYPEITLVTPASNPFLPDEPTPTSVETLLSAVNKTPVDILLLCLGAPKSEAHLDACRDQMQAKVVLCVGATVDFLAGTVQRAPHWVQRIGLEWAFRLIQEPKRLWRRYMTSGVGFISIFLSEAINLMMPANKTNGK